MAKRPASTKPAAPFGHACAKCGKSFTASRFYSADDPTVCIYCKRPPLSAESQAKAAETRRQMAKTAPKIPCKRCKREYATHLMQDGFCISCVKVIKKEKDDEAAAAYFKAKRAAVAAAAPPPPPPPLEAPNVTVSQVPLAELAARELARRDLIHFTQRFHKKYKAGWVHKYLARRLKKFMQDVAEQRSPRLLICFPPRGGKSELTSRKFPPWVLGHHPDWEIISTSHTQGLSMSFSRHTRDMLRDPGYQAVFEDTRLDPDSQSVENWNTTAGGGYVAAGVGTGITGRGAHILIIDDPVKDMEAADSQTVRDSTWEWYTSTAYTRLAPGGGVLGIMTLWNDDDWGGRIIAASEAGEGDKFEILRFPAINEGYDEFLLPETDEIIRVYDEGAQPQGAELLRPRGTALHPERYDTEHLLRIKRNFYATGSGRVWSALYQQDPAPEEGAFFTKDMMQYFRYPPHRRSCYVYQAWDFAISEKAISDYTVCSTMAQDEYDSLYELDLERFRSSNSFVIVDAILDQYERYKPDLIGFEDGQIWKSIKALFEKRCQERRLYPNYEVLTPLTDKLVRAGPLRGRMQMRKVWFKEEAPWRREADQEMLRFPAGKHDDIIDARAWCVRLTLTRSAPKPAEPPKLKSWKDGLLRFTDGGGGGHMSA